MLINYVYCTGITVTLVVLDCPAQHEFIYGLRRHQPQVKPGILRSAVCIRHYAETRLCATRRTLVPRLSWLNCKQRISFCCVELTGLVDNRKVGNYTKTVYLAVTHDRTLSYEYDIRFTSKVQPWKYVTGRVTKRKYQSIKHIYIIIMQAVYCGIMYLAKTVINWYTLVLKQSNHK